MLGQVISLGHDRAAKARLAEVRPGLFRFARLGNFNSN
jgi:hypothetical protein